MAESSEVRVVRCPKCENLLPELSDLPTYQCGGCGTFLRGKNKGPMKDGLLEKSNEEGNIGDIENGSANLYGGSEADRESSKIGLHKTKGEDFNSRDNDLSVNSPSRTKNPEVLLDSDSTLGGEIDKIGSHCNQSDQAGYRDDNYRKFPKILDTNWERGKDHFMSMSMNRPSYDGSRVENDLQQGLKPSFRSLGPKPVMDWRGMGANGSVAGHRNARGVADRGSFSTSSYPDEGPSSFHFGPYSCGEQVRNCVEELRNHDKMDEHTRAVNLDNYRSELLKKLDELKDQLSKSCNVVEHPKQSIAVDERMFPPPPNPGGGREAFVPYNTTISSDTSMQSITRDEYVAGPYLDRNHGPVFGACRHGLHLQDIYPNRTDASNGCLGYGGSYQTQMFRKPLHQPPHEYLQQQQQQQLQQLYHEHFPEGYMGYPHESHPRDTFLHQPSCSRSHYHYNCQKTSQKFPPSVFHSQRSWHEPVYSECHQHIDHVKNGQPGYDFKGTNPQPRYHCNSANPQLHPWDQHVQTRSSSDPDFDNGAFAQRHPRRVIVAHGRRRICHPIAGGAPFLSCYNCFELLKLPKKPTLIEKKQRRVRCGACSSTIYFQPDNKGLAVSFPVQIREVAAEVDDGNCETLANLQDSNGFSYANVGNSCNSSNQSSYSNSDKRHESGTSSSCSPRVLSPDSLIDQRSAEFPSKDDGSPALPDLHTQKHSDYSSNNNALSKNGNGNKSKHAEQKMSQDRTNSRTNSIKDIPTATEMEVSSNDFLDGGISQDTVEVSKEDLPQITKGVESSFVGLLKKRFRDFSKSGQSLENGRFTVSVNGQLIPYSAVKKAEKLAGPIQPGDYWYDYQAGFWGVMGHPCLGVIPPFIEEFNYPIPENCAGGNTEIFVNGRELHKKDLDLLADRGLPIMRNKYYLIEISGRILDEQTGEELENLGKLAPTVERVGHGFGMKVPKDAAK